MYDDMRIMAIIPARSGSKRLPGKNIKLLGRKPLIAWSIEQAKTSKYIDEVIISTDSEEISRIAKELGGNVPFLRPVTLAQDNTPMIDVVAHVLSETEKSKGYLPDFVVLLQPTSPLRTLADVDAAIEMLVTNKTANAVVSITEVSESPYWMKSLTSEDFVEDFLENKEKYDKRQDVPIVYRLNGAIYFCKVSILLETRNFCPENTLGYVMPEERSVDIDSIIDFKLAELMIFKK
jgi:CMP-N-acetylneuraminic acid synthetase